MDLKAEAVERKKALFLHYVGPAVYDIYDTLKADGDKYKEVKQKLDDYFSYQSVTLTSVPWNLPWAWPNTCSGLYLGMQI